MDYGQNTVAVQYTIENHSQTPCTLTATPWLRFIPKGGRMTSRRRFDWSASQVRSGGLRLRFAVEGGIAEALPDCQYETLRFRHDAPDGRTPTGLCGAAGRFVFTAAPGQTRPCAVVLGTGADLPTAGAVLASQARRRQEQAQAAGLHTALGQALSAAADAFIVERASTQGKTIVAGYPFFTDWGRDTMIALPGCTLSTGRYEDARSILRTFAANERDGLLPNLFPDQDAQPQYNTADAALLFINCLWLYYTRTQDDAFAAEMWPCAARIVQCYRQGTSHGIHMDADGLLCAGEGLDQVTWMDVRIGTHLPTPRHGKPVEINAYWYNALRIMARLAPLAGADGGPYAQLAAQAGASFRQAFWMPGEQRLRDVISPSPPLPIPSCGATRSGPYPCPSPPSPGTRPPGWCAASVRLYGPPAACAPSTPPTPTSTPSTAGPRRSGIWPYHQGTVWPFPLGGYYLAQLRVGDFSPASCRQVRQDLDALLPALREGCLGSLPEIYDGGVPGPSRGCFAQAWSVGELLRVCEALERPQARAWRAAGPRREISCSFCPFIDRMWRFSH